MKKRNKKLYIPLTMAVIFILISLIILFIFTKDDSYINNDKNITVPESESSVESPKTLEISENNILPGDNAAADTEQSSAGDSTSDNANPVISDNEITDGEISDGETSENEMSEGESKMEHPDRVTYRAGFYFEPITEDIKERIYGLSYKEDCTVPYDDLRYVSVLYKNFKGETDYGEIICNKAIAQDLVEIFYELFENDYPIDKIRLIDEYNADDDLSCQDNNTSCFNYRVVYGSNNLSKHALGMAIDINPFYNPYVTYPDGVERISPPGSEPYANRDADLPYMIKKGDLCYNLFIERGFTWGGEWKTLKDYQHFQKVLD